jgi:hypothetical protein
VLIVCGDYTPSRAIYPELLAVTGIC